jgi:hypothetical protein
MPAEHGDRRTGGYQQANDRSTPARIFDKVGVTTRLVVAVSGLGPSDDDQELS